MKYLKGYKIFENHEDIHVICRKYRITNYIINDDGSIDVDGDVNLSYRKLTKLPINFRNVSGDFYCYRNQLTSLVGAPESVGGNFYCSDNKLTSLEGAPESVSGNFNCYNNQLTSLVGAPESVGGYFNCDNNNLTSLEGTPRSVSGNFYYHNNPVNSVISTWINIKSRRWELMEYFEEMNVIQGDNVILPRLIAFYEDMNVEIPDIKEIKKHYKIVE
jgi:hypothetical protein